MNKKTLYSGIIQDHYHNPRYQGSLEYFNFKGSSVNPACGDSILITGLIENGCIIKLAHSGKGCMISQATASIVAEKILARNMIENSQNNQQINCDLIEEIRTLTANDIISWIGIPLGPNRLKCAVLALEALQKGLEDYARSN